MSPVPRPNRVISSAPFSVPFTAPVEIERRRGRRFRLRLGANESPFGCSDLVPKALQALLHEVTLYPDPRSYELRCRIAKLHALHEDEVLVAGGIDELLGLTIRVYLDAGDVAVTSKGSYPTVGYHVSAVGGRLKEVEYHRDRPDLDALLDAAADPHCKIVYLANPDNPSGAHFDREQMARFCTAVPPSVLLLLDQAYVDFAPLADRERMPLSENVLQLRTFSKAHGLASLRIGYLLGTERLLREFEKVRLHFGVNAFAQAAAIAALADADFTESVVQRTTAARAHYARLAAELELPLLPSSTNFVLFDVGTASRAQGLSDLLESRDVFVRRPGRPPLDRCVRVSVGTPAEQRDFASVLGDIVASGALARFDKPHRAPSSSPGRPAAVE